MDWWFCNCHHSKQFCCMSPTSKQTSPSCSGALVINPCACRLPHQRMILMGKLVCETNLDTVSFKKLMISLKTPPHTHTRRREITRACCNCRHRVNIWMTGQHVCAQQLSGTAEESFQSREVSTVVAGGRLCCALRIVMALNLLELVENSYFVLAAHTPQSLRA